MLSDDEPIGWVEGIDLFLQTHHWVPAELVHTDYTVAPARGSGYFLASTNGLASGNHILEAIGAAICELVERDAVALWHARPPQLRAASHLDLASIIDAGCEVLLERYAAAGMQVRVWDVTSDVGIPAFLCWIREADAAYATLRNTFAGAGCHPDSAVALSRALTEAALSRMNVIVGVRDDLPTDYQVRAAAAVGPVLLDVFAASFPAVRFDAQAGFRSSDLADDLRWELSCLQRAGLSQAIVVDLTNTEIGIPVVRVVIPGLEGNCHHPSYVPGARARAIGGSR
jgi:ribosomal protein S12 methylthiotransferase accessory factor